MISTSFELGRCLFHAKVLPPGAGMPCVSSTATGVSCSCPLGHSSIRRHFNPLTLGTTRKTPCARSMGNVSSDLQHGSRIVTQQFRQRPTRDTDLAESARLELMQALRGAYEVRCALLPRWPLRTLHHAQHSHALLLDMLYKDQRLPRI